jgi:hypothetical protein
MTKKSDRGFQIGVLVALSFVLLIECDTIPEHVHISLTSHIDEIAVMWYTRDPAESLVQYFPRKNEDKKTTIKGSSKLLNFSDPKMPGYMHLVILKGLSGSTTYSYKVGSEYDGWSALFQFKTQPKRSPPEHKVRLLSYGDMGVKYEKSLQSVRTIAPLSRALDIDLVLHAGDLAYAFKNFTIWDIWFERVQSIAAYVPYMVCPGNRDEEEIIEERFNFPKAGLPSTRDPKRSNLYYSFDYSWIHVVAISIKDDYQPGSEQHDWLEQDLRKAHARIRDGTGEIKWIVLFGHTPLYSSSDGHKQGNKELKASIEDMLYMYDVSITIWGDDHVYERSYPMFKDLPDKTSMYIDPTTKRQTFVSPNKTIHLLAGTGGIDLDGWVAGDPPLWSAYREEVNGFVDIEATQTTLRVRFLRLNGSIADEFSIVKRQSEASIHLGWLLIPAVVAGVLYYVRTSRSFLAPRRTL